MEAKKIVHVHLKKPSEAHEGQQDFYFGSIRAIFSVLTRDDIGRTYGSLTSSSIMKNGGVFENKKCTINVSEIVRNKKNTTKGV
jgi:hypothetical protein